MRVDVREKRSPPGGILSDAWTTGALCMRALAFGTKADPHPPVELAYLCLVAVEPIPPGSRHHFFKIESPVEGVEREDILDRKAALLLLPVGAGPICGLPCHLDFCPVLDEPLQQHAIETFIGSPPERVDVGAQRGEPD